MQIFVDTLSVSLTVGLAIILLKFFLPLVNRYYLMKWQYFLWLVLAVRLLIPFNLSAPVAMIPLDLPSISVAQTYLSQMPTPQVAETTTAQAIVEKAAPRVSKMALAEAIWLLGMVGYLGYQFGGYLIFRRRVLRWSQGVENRAVDACFEELTAQMGIGSKGVTVLTSKAVTSPLLLGFFRPWLLLPEVDYEQAELRFILKHELVHYKRRDVWYKLILVLAKGMHWFNPAVWLMVEEATKAIEFSCDDEVIKDGDLAFKKAYGATLLLAMEKGAMRKIALTTYFRGGSQLMKERLHNIFAGKEKRVGIWLSAFILVGVLFAGSMASFSVAEAGGSSIENIYLVVRDCNVRVEKSPDGQFHYQYQEEKMQLSTKTKNSTLMIQLSGRGEQQSLKEIAVIFVPDQSYDKVTVVNERGGVSLPVLDAHVKMTSDHGASSIQVGESFSKSIDYTNTKGSGSLRINGKAKDYTLALEVEGSSVSVGKPLPPYDMTKFYQYQNGTGQGQIKVTIKGSSFAVVVEEKETTEQGKVLAIASFPKNLHSESENYALYEPFGLTYDQKAEGYFYQGQLVRYFEDFYPIDGQNQAGVSFVQNEGAVDVHGVRDLNNLVRHPDGSLDPSGTLMGLQAYSTAEFKARDLVLEQSQAGMALSEGEWPTPEQLAEDYAVYKPFGLTYDQKAEQLFYQGKSVRYFLDVMSSNGETLTGGKFQGTMRKMIIDEKGRVDIYVLRDYTQPDAQGYGQILGVKPYSQAEFDKRSENDQ